MALDTTSYLLGKKKGGGGSGSASWGSITGTLSNQTDLNTALSGKQETLVSGTNIKTINNTSLLGSGDITIQGGGGYDYIIDMRSAKETINIPSSGDAHGNWYIAITDNGILQQLNQIITDGVYDENNRLKPLKVGLYMSLANMEEDSAFMSSVGVSDDTYWSLDESNFGEYLSYDIIFLCSWAGLSYIALHCNKDHENISWFVGGKVGL